MLVNKKILIDAIAMLLLGTVLIVGYKLSPLILPKADVTVMPEAGCDLNRGACRATSSKGESFVLSIAPQPIPVIKPLKLAVALDIPDIKRVELDLAGIDMNMGLNRPVLQPDGSGKFVGEATLPVCITGGMSWQATLLVETGSAQIAVPFTFKTGEH